jgi:hypothetical protein
MRNKIIHFIEILMFRVAIETIIIALCKADHYKGYTEVILDQALKSNYHYQNLNKKRYN